MIFIQQMSLSSFVTAELTPSTESFAYLKSLYNNYRGYCRENGIYDNLISSYEEFDEQLERELPLCRAIHSELIHAGKDEHAYIRPMVYYQVSLKKDRREVFAVHKETVLSFREESYIPCSESLEI